MHAQQLSLAPWIMLSRQTFFHCASYTCPTALRMQEEREAVMRAEEEAFRSAMMAKFAEDDRLEQMNAARRRMRQAEHAREVQRLIDERRRMYAEAKARDEAEQAAVAAEQVRVRGVGVLLSTVFLIMKGEGGGFWWIWPRSRPRQCTVEAGISPTNAL
jgi:hypothetical protein